MNSIYPPEPCLSPPEPVETYDERAEAELHYMQHNSALADFAKDLGEALAFEDLSRLALLMRGKDAAAVRDEIARMFDGYWSRQIKARLPAEDERLRRLA